MLTVTAPFASYPTDSCAAADAAITLIAIIAPAKQTAKLPLIALMVSKTIREYFVNLFSALLRINILSSTLPSLQEATYKDNENPLCGQLVLIYNPANMAKILPL